MKMMPVVVGRASSLSSFVNLLQLDRQDACPTNGGAR
jgi:hypothetical protein